MQLATATALLATQQAVQDLRAGVAKQASVHHDGCFLEVALGKRYSEGSTFQMESKLCNTRSRWWQGARPISKQQRTQSRKHAGVVRERKLTRVGGGESAQSKLGPGGQLCTEAGATKPECLDLNSGSPTGVASRTILRADGSKAGSPNHTRASGESSAVRCNATAVPDHGLTHIEEQSSVMGEVVLKATNKMQDTLR